MLGEQIEKYEQVRRAHMVFRLNGWDSTQAQAALDRADEIMRKIYTEQCVKPTDMKIRDKVLERIKDAFYHTDGKTQSYLLEGEITISATGSCMNGLWTASGSDIDVVIVFHNRMAYNQHQLVKHCGKVIRSVAKNGTLCYVPAVKVPLLKYQDELTGIEVDLSVNNILA